MADKPKRPFIGASPIIFLIAMAVALSLSSLLNTTTPAKRIPYSEFLDDLHNDRVQKAEIKATDIIADLKPDASAQDQKPVHVATERLPRIDESKLIDELRERKVEFSGKVEEQSWFSGIIYGWLIPFGLIFAIYFFGLRRLQGRGSPMSFGKNRAKLYDANKEKKITFADVAGIDEAVAEMTEVVDFLKNPGKYRRLGAKIPKGVLLLGPPGTGKTLMARAVAGEASVPFFNMSGSEFVEMFVGVGAARVRDLFEQAKQRSPCIIFIDEIDAIGKSRGGIAAVSMHDEREQTLNQLLAEMDGFDDAQGVVIIAATNRPEVLDQALVRAGRFDRQVVVDRPSWEGRLAILKIHTRTLTLADGVNLETIARRTPGMVGADLAKVANEAALAAARRGSNQIDQKDFEESVDRIQLGLKKTGRSMNEEEKRRVAYHESGHAIIALSVAHADPVHRVTIIPRTIGALGATLQLPTEDRYLMLRAELRDRICVMLGGRAAEELALDDVSTGAQNDLERATETARQMVCRFGMSAQLGTATYGRPMGSRFLELPVTFGDERNFSEETAQKIDREVLSIMEEEHERANKILSDKRALLEAMTERLLVDETLERSDIEALMAKVGMAEEPRARLTRTGT